MLNVPLEKVHARAALVGGGFGGKEDMTVQPYAVLMSYVTKRPVKVKYSRQESLDYHVKRHPMTMEFTTACDENGRLTAMKGVIIADTGAYASLGGPVLARACTHAAGPYNYQNLDFFGMSVYTNNVVSGAFRGFGVTEKFECEEGFPRSRFAKIGFLRADEAPEMETILIRPSEEEKSPFSNGAKGCGELCMIPAAPACASAYYRFDGEFRQSLPISHTPYRKD